MKNPKTVIFVGTGEFGVPVLKKLAKDKRFRIPFIITSPDKPSGRGLKTIQSSIKKAGLLNKLIIHQTVRISDLKQKLIQEKPDFLLVVSYGEIIPKVILQIPNLGPINIHPSLLPKYRGASPLQETLLHGDRETGITWIFMTEKMDAGDIISQERLSISPEDNFPTLSQKLSQLAAKKTPHVLSDFAKLCHSEIIESMTQRRKQDEHLASYCRKIQKSDGFLNPVEESAQQMLRKIKAYTPWPGCFIFRNKKRIKIVQADISEQKIGTGEVEVTDGKKMSIGTRKGVLLPLRVQPESKQEMSIEEFLRGQKKLKDLL